MSKLQDRIDMIENPESRVPCVILIDTSGSMMGEPIREVNSGIKRFIEEIREDELTALRADVAIIAFNDRHQTIQNFGEMLEAETTILTAGGGTKMAPPLKDALQMMERRKQLYRDNGVPYYRPILVLITDGYPTDPKRELEDVADEVKQAQRDSKLTFFPIGTEQADMARLQSMSIFEPKTLRGTNFVELFQWLSNSITKISHSQPGDKVGLPATDGWSLY